MMVKNNNIIVTGCALLPKGTTLNEKYKTITAVVVINVETEMIEDAEFTFLTDLTNYYVSAILRGYHLQNGINPLIDNIRSHVLIPSQGAVIQSVKSAWDRYNEYKQVLSETIHQIPS